MKLELNPVAIAVHMALAEMSGEPMTGRWRFLRRVILEFDRSGLYWHFGFQAGMVPGIKGAGNIAANDGPR